jgi:hypothetical protein
MLILFHMMRRVMIKRFLTLKTHVKNTHELDFKLIIGFGAIFLSF